MVKVIPVALFFGLLMFGCGDSVEPDELIVFETVESSKAIDLDDKQTLGKILDGAIDLAKMEQRGEKGEELVYLAKERTPYSGWVKMLFPNGCVEVLTLVKAGKPVSLTQWYENGRKLSEEKHQGEVIETERWHENGRRAERFSLVNGNKHGAGKSWYENGLKKAETKWLDGEVEGLQVFWYENGQKKMEVNFVKSLRSGPKIQWYRNGQKRFEARFKGGRLESCVVWKPRGEKCPVSFVEAGTGVVVNYKEDGSEQNRLVYSSGSTIQNISTEN